MKRVKVSSFKAALDYLIEAVLEPFKLAGTALEALWKVIRVISPRTFIALVFALPALYKWLFTDADTNWLYISGFLMAGALVSLVFDVDKEETKRNSHE